jgi:hypothetical protein
MIGCLLLAPAAHAGQGNSTTPTFPVASNVGDTELDASIEILNVSTPPQSGGTSTICNVGDTGLCAGDQGITLVPSCGAVDPSLLTCTRPDPDVFAVTSTPTGAAGSACAGVVFDVVVVDAAVGRLRFTPRGGVSISLAPGAVCSIAFKISVLKLPTVDEDLAATGVQTKQLASSRLVSTVSATSGQGTGTSFGTTVNPPPPPPPPAPPPPCVPPPGPAPPGGVLCAPVAPSSAAPATARITGRTGCVTRNFDVAVSGQNIRRVTFTIDGRPVRTLTRPNRGSRYVLPIRPGRLARGTHRVLARTLFTAESGARARTLRVVFQRCARVAGAPRFTG